MPYTMPARLRRTAGYTIDQTILIVAIIAILVTLIIGSVGFDLLNRSSGTKLGSHLKQVEEGNSGFYGRNGMWPHQARGVSTVDATNIMMLSDRATYESELPNGNFKNYLPGFEKTASGMQHAFGRGGLITQGPGSFEGSEYMIIEFANVPDTHAQEADEAIDNGDGPADGRLQYTVGSGSQVNATYYANLLN